MTSASPINLHGRIGLATSLLRSSCTLRRSGISSAKGSKVRLLWTDCRPGSNAGASRPSFVVLLLLAIYAFFGLAAFGQPSSLNLAWDANPEPDIAGYNLYYGEHPQTSANRIVLGNVTNTRVEGLLFRTTYFFYVTARNESGLESDPSNEVLYWVNTPPVAQPQATSTTANTPLSIALTGSDADSESLTFRIHAGPAQGTLSGPLPNITYTPNTGFSGTDSFQFVVNDGYVDSMPALVSITVNSAGKSNQAISFAPPATLSLSDGALILTATASSGLPIAFSVLAGPAILFGNTLSPTGPGVITVRASQAGNENYNPAPPVDQTVNVGAAEQTIHFEPIGNRNFGEGTFALIARSSLGLPISFSVVSGPARVEGPIVTLLGAGPIVFRASEAGDQSHPSSVDQTLVAGRASQVITFPSPEGLTLAEGSVQIMASSSSGLPLDFTILSGPATVSGSVLTLRGPGQIVLRASQSGDGNYLPAAPIEQTFTIGLANQTINFHPIGNRNFGEGTFDLQASSGSGLPVSFTVESGPATLDGPTVTLTGVGEVLFKASQGGNANFNPAEEVAQTLKVGLASQVITFPSPPVLSLAEGSVQIMASSSSGLPLDFTILSGPATVSGSVLTLRGPGQIVLRASQSGDGNYLPAAPIERIFTIDLANQTINFHPIGDRNFGEGTFALQASSSSGLPVSFTVAAGPATLDGQTVTLTGAGEVLFKAWQGGNAHFNPATEVAQTLTAGRCDQKIEFHPIGNKNFGEGAFALAATSSSGLPVSFQVVSGLAVIDGTTVTLTGAGSVLFRSFQDGDLNHNPAPEVEQLLIVGKGSQAINFQPIATKVFGEPPFVLQATASSGLPVQFTVVSGGAEILGNQVFLRSGGRIVIKASQPSSDHYSAAPDAEQSFDVHYTLGLNVEGSGRLSPVPEKSSYPAGTVVRIQALAGHRFSFNGWSGDASGTESGIKIVMDGNKSLQALFSPAPLRPPSLVPLSGVNSGTVHLVLTGEPLVEYEIQVSTDLINWRFLRIIRLVEKTFEFIEPSSDGRMQFYRVKAVQ